MKKILYNIPYLFFILVYANEGISGLPDQCLYYLTREHWHLSAGLIGMIGFITAVAWYIKPVWGMLIDYMPIKHYRSKYYLYLSYILLLGIYAFIIIFGLNLITLIITGLLLNICIGISDVANDSQMVIYEQKYKLQGKLQALQWTSLGIAGLIVSLGGAFIADKFDITVNYRIAYLFASIIPIFTLFYLWYFYKENPVKKIKPISNIIHDFKKVLDPKLILALVFIACFQLSPSFGTALMIKSREQLMVSKMFLGYLGATGTILGIIGYILYYWKFHKFPIKQLLYFMILFSGLTNLFYLYIPNKWYLLIYNIVFGAFSGITFLTLLSYFAMLVPKGSEGMIYALITSISNLCARGGSWLGGIIYDHWGYNTNVIVSTFLTLLCILFIPFLQLKERKNYVK